ncbi:Is30 family transposase [Staphylococcus aureus]|nr:Is30 family transposase [Staphylococcus aureus]
MLITTKTHTRSANMSYQEQLDYALDSINYRPRKCLNWKFPYEVLCDELLHLN